MTPLKGADGQVYAIAQGNLAVGGFGVEGKDGSSLSVNIPTVGSIANGATVEKMVETPFIKNKNFVMNLHQGDFTTANRIVEEINKLINFFNNSICSSKITLMQIHHKVFIFYKWRFYHFFNCCSVCN